MLMKYLPKELVELRRMEDLVAAMSKPQKEVIVEPVVSEEVTEQTMTETSTPEQISDLPFLDRLKLIKEIDTSVGMGYCMENEEFYEEMIKEYLNSAKAEPMRKYFEAQDWANYQITVHALKSTSLTIGAVELSEQAKALEMAYKENNITYVQDNHIGVLEHYEGFVRALQDVSFPILLLYEN
jgi:HPt (histidine-containing phosphotransfer) domain-containing protein